MCQMKDAASKECWHGRQPVPHPECRKAFQRSRSSEIFINFLQFTFISSEEMKEGAFLVVAPSLWESLPQKVGLFPFGQQTKLIYFRQIWGIDQLLREKLLMDGCCNFFFFKVFNLFFFFTHQCLNSSFSCCSSGIGHHHGCSQLRYGSSIDTVLHPRYSPEAAQVLFGA